MFYSLVHFMFRSIYHYVFRCKYTGLDNIPPKGPYIICANHISYWDPPLVGTMIRGQKTHFMAKKELFDVPVLKSIIKRLGAFPVKRSTADRKAIVQSLKVLKDKEILILFPEGTRSKNGQLGKPLPGVGMIAMKSKTPVLPVAINGPYKLFGGLKVNIGKPLNLDKYFNEKSSSELLATVSEEIMSEIKLLLE